MYNYRRSCSEYSLYQRVIIILIQIIFVSTVLIIDVERRVADDNRIPLPLYNIVDIVPAIPMYEFHHPDPISSFFCFTNSLYLRV